jgi:hypothetical protein
VAEGLRKGDSQQPRTVEILRRNISAPRRCRACGVSIIFVQRVASTKATPFRAPLTILEDNRDTLVVVDTNHFIDCPAAKRFRK